MVRVAKVWDLLLWDFQTHLGAALGVLAGAEVGAEETQRSLPTPPSVGQSEVMRSMLLTE